MALVSSPALGVIEGGVSSGNEVVASCSRGRVVDQPDAAGQGDIQRFNFNNDLFSDALRYSVGVFYTRLGQDNGNSSPP